jgi:hypothetical protein
MNPAHRFQLLIKAGLSPQEAKKYYVDHASATYDGISANKEVIEFIKQKILDGWKIQLITDNSAENMRNIIKQIDAEWLLDENDNIVDMFSYEELENPAVTKKNPEAARYLKEELKAAELMILDDSPTIANNFITEGITPVLVTENGLIECSICNGKPLTDITKIILNSNSDKKALNK